jgi:F0F1-type ATP synthase membrane subunit c/vacuolar-type H+-ATPase subunit K
MTFLRPTTILALAAGLALGLAGAPQVWAQGTVTGHCKDGTYSKSKHHSGACSRHGGVQQWLQPADAK